MDPIKKIEISFFLASPRTLSRLSRCAGVECRWSSSGSKTAPARLPLRGKSAQASSRDGSGRGKPQDHRVLISYERVLRTGVANGCCVRRCFGLCQHWRATFRRARRNTLRAETPRPTENARHLRGQPSNSSRRSAVASIRHRQSSGLAKVLEGLPRTRQELDKNSTRIRQRILRLVWLNCVLH